MEAGRICIRKAEEKLRCIAGRGKARRQAKEKLRGRQAAQRHADRQKMRRKGRRPQECASIKSRNIPGNM